MLHLNRVVVNSEVGQPVHKRTIKPLSIGGIAGGDKFIARNLFIKFCSDEVQLKLYGGAHFAQKAASHELKSLNALISAAVPSLHFPLMCVFMCKGYRVVVISKLPISHSTLCYGSADAGKTIKTDPAFDKLMRAAAAKLNIAPHVVREEGAYITKEVVGPVDLEGHKGADARTYVCDVSRLFPCTFPMKGVPGCHLYKLFRQEYVKGNPEPLSSDAFSHFGREDCKVHNERVKVAFTRLVQETLPQLALELSASSSVFRGDELKETLHARGINLRFCGYLLTLLSTLAAQSVLCAEMVARTVKNELYELLRTAVQRGNDKETCVSYLNRCFGGSSRAAYWASNAVPLFARYFEFTRLPAYNAEPVVEAAVRPALDALLCDDAQVAAVLLRACTLAGVVLDRGCAVDASRSEPLSATHVASFRTQVKMMRFDASNWGSDRSFEETERFYLDAISHAKSERGEHDFQTIKAMLNLATLYAGGGKGREADAKQWFESAISAASALRGPQSLTAAEIREQFVSFLATYDPKMGLEQVKQVLQIKEGIPGIETELAATLDMSAGLASVQGDYVHAKTSADRALQLKRTHSTELDCAFTTLTLGKICLMQGQHTGAMSHLQDAMKVLEAHKDTVKLHHAMDLLAQVSAAQGDFQRAEELYMRALELKVSIGVQIDLWLVRLVSKRPSQTISHQLWFLQHKPSAFLTNDGFCSSHLHF